MYLMGGLLGGLILGVSLVLVLNGLAGKIFTSADTRDTTGLPILAIIPTVTRREENNGDELLPVNVVGQRKSCAAEAFRDLRKAILRPRPSESPKVILVSSSSPGAGKSFTSFNLAHVLAQGGARTLLIDGDLRCGTQQTITGVLSNPGLVSVLSGTVLLEEAIKPVPGDVPLFLLPTGPRPPHPVDLLGSSQMEGVITELREQFDFIVIDSPPVLPVTDAIVIARLCDVMILVVRSGVSQRRAGKLLQPIATKILGTVLNDD